ncbi:MAG: hypothetical protein RBR35_19695 [Salinivirgaceae bacterium]|nr:hypothetical protein [Salinivirgaceae bacterium]
MKHTKHQRMYDRIRKHGADLNNIFGLDEDPVALCKRLRRLETKAHKLAEDYCNGLIEPQDYELQADKLLAKVDQLLHYEAAGVPVLLNGDPRGYALKISAAYVREHNLAIHRDWGGYGILAPDLRED